MSLIGSDSVNRQPSSTNPLNDAGSAQPYRVSETRIQLSVRTKILQGLLTQGQPSARDTLWFGYTQQSYWQLFTPQLSRPFRSTDDEPEIVCVYPTDAQLPGGWRLRYSGVGLVHPSRGQSLPLSRSWNRVYLMVGMDLDHRWRLHTQLLRGWGDSLLDYNRRRSVLSAGLSLVDF